MPDTLKIHLLCSGIISGSIIFQIAIIAPSVFKLLGGDNVKSMLRHIFPRLFMFLSFTSLVPLIFIYLFGAISPIQYPVSILSFLVPTICFLLIPKTNRAKDNGDEKRFSVLHTISVILTVVLLSVNLLWLFFV